MKCQKLLCLKSQYNDCDFEFEGKTCSKYIDCIKWSNSTDKLYSLFGNIIKPHRFLRTNALCEIDSISGDAEAVFIKSAISKGGRRVHDFYIPIKYLGNFRIKYSYSKCPINILKEK